MQALFCFYDFCTPTGRADYVHSFLYAHLPIFMKGAIHVFPGMICVNICPYKPGFLITRKLDNICVILLTRNRKFVLKGWHQMCCLSRKDKSARIVMNEKDYRQVLVCLFRTFICYLLAYDKKIALKIIKHTKLSI